MLLDFRDLVAGNGYIAGESIGQAQAEFRSAYKSVLYDIAAEAPSFEAFKAQVERFFRETNRPTLAEWEEAVS